MNVNKITIVGRLTRDVELKATPSGTKVASFSVATSYKFKKADGTKEESTEFHNCVAFGKSAELIAQYMIKGSEIYLEGRVQTRTWEDKEKNKKSRTEIIVGEFQFGAKPAGAGSSTTTKKEDAGAEDDGGLPEDIPF